MKICNTCGYVEYWGSQAELVCPNCDEAIMRVRWKEKNLQKYACKNEINLKDSTAKFAEKRRLLFP